MADKPFFEAEETFQGSLADEWDGLQGAPSKSSAEDEAVGCEAEGRKGPVVGKVDLVRIERAVREILLAVGEDPDREGLRETPNRVARMYAELFSGLREDPREHLQKFFPEKYDEIVLVRNIGFHSV